MNAPNDTSAVTPMGQLLAVIGQGYVGLPLAMRAAQQGFRVVGFDVAAERVAELRAGRSYVGDVSSDELAAALAAGFLPTSDPADLAGFDVAVVSVPTPGPTSSTTSSGPTSPRRTARSTRFSSSRKFWPKSRSGRIP